MLVRAYDRRGLVRDISAVLTDAKLSIQAANALTQQDGVADMSCASWCTIWKSCRASWAESRDCPM
jgi:UTP:GlnB (protein PII) uridylyltransferase